MSLHFLLNLSNLKQTIWEYILVFSGSPCLSRPAHPVTHWNIHVYMIIKWFYCFLVGLCVLALTKMQEAECNMIMRITFVSFCLYFYFILLFFLGLSDCSKYFIFHILMGLRLRINHLMPIISYDIYIWLDYVNCRIIRECFIFKSNVRMRTNKTEAVSSLAGNGNVLSAPRLPSWWVRHESLALLIRFF